MLRIDNKACVIVGGGRVAARKATNLLAANARLTIISPDFCEAIHRLIPSEEQPAGTLSLLHTRYKPGMLAVFQPFLVFATTDDPAINRQVLDEAHTLGALVGVADDPERSDFHSMTTVQRGLLTLAVSTEGASPALVQHARQRLETAFGVEYATLSTWLQTLRPIIRQRVDTQAERAALWDRLLKSDVLPYLREGNEDKARAVVRQITGVEF